MKPIHRKFFIVMLFLMLIAALNLGPGAAPAFTQPASLSQPELDTLKADFQRLKIDLERLKTDLEEVKRELRFIRQSLGQSSSQSTQPGRVVTTVSISGNPIMGKKDAPVTLIEFSNYQCLLCSQFFQITLPELKGGYIDTGKVRYIFRDLPLDQIYPHARKAAEAAHCAGDQGKYWEMHDLLFQNQQALQVEKLKGYAGNLDLDLTAFDDCLEKGK
ncbi:MAG: thioredoxin domain-containing protein, partial [Candidatus Tectomicrobia bacterium]|nr:thioredoxin domain-containing protein [Candidatus Tectomicrobia bacterium]